MPSAHARLEIVVDAGRREHRYSGAGLWALERPPGPPSRRAQGKDNPRQPRSAGDPAGHIPRSWFRHHIWQPALTAADLPLHVRPHDLRHAHASWLLAGGADLQTVKERLGHGTITTTEQYLHTLNGADDTAHGPEQQQTRTLSTRSGQRSDLRRLREGVHKGTQRQSSRAA
jgi:integrase